MLPDLLLKLKSPVFVSCIIATFGVGACTSFRLAKYRERVASMPPAIERANLYAEFPPLEDPRPFPGFSTSSGARGSESYPIDEHYLLTANVFYGGRIDRSYFRKLHQPLDKPVDADPQDLFTEIEIKKRKGRSQR